MSVFDGGFELGGSRFLQGTEEVSREVVFLLLHSLRSLVANLRAGHLAALLPPFPSLNLTCFRELCRCLLFITADGFFNSHHGAPHADPAHSDRHAVAERRVM